MRAKRVDSNHADIRTKLRKAGFTVHDTSRLGEGFPDLVVVLENGRVALLFEIKTEDGGQFKPDEVSFMLKMVQPAYRVVTTAEQANDILKQEGKS